MADSGSKRTTEKKSSGAENRKTPVQKPVSGAGGKSAAQKSNPPKPAAKKSPAKKKKRSRIIVTKPTIKKGKIKISPTKVIWLCSGVIAMCLVLLLVTTIGEKPKKSRDNPPSITERFEKDLQGNNAVVSNSSGQKSNENSTAKKGGQSENAKKSNSQSKNAAATSSSTKSDSKNANATAQKSAPKSDSQSGTVTANKSNQKSNSQNGNVTSRESAQKSDSQSKNDTSQQSTPKLDSQNASVTTQKSTPKTDSQSENKLSPKANSQIAKVDTPNANVQGTISPTQKSATQSSAASQTAKPSDQITNALNKFNFPPAVNHAELVFLFDDGGQNLNQLQAFLDLPIPITVAVLPKLQHSAESASRIRKSGNEVMLHQPMQAINSAVNPGPGAIKPEMTSLEIAELVQSNIDEIAPISGMNNHEGSLITADESKIRVVLDTAAENGIFFLDSRTNVETKVPAASRKVGYGWYERNGRFLDNEKTRDEFLTELRKNLDIANKSGSVIMIGHIWSADYLPDLIREVYPELKAKGYTFKTVSNSSARKM